MLLGLALVVICAIGVFFGRIIQSAPSSQREFLADAASVQFTRTPAGLSGALHKIGGAGLELESAHAGEASHMFFGNGLGKLLHGMMATHPLLAERIQAIEPSWDGKFKTANVAAVAAESARNSAKPASSRTAFPPILGMSGVGVGDAGFATNAVLMGAVFPNLGRPTLLQLCYAEAVRNSFSEMVQSAARDPLDATALIYAMLVSTDETLRAKQLSELARRAAPGMGEKAAWLWHEIESIDARAPLPLVNLALPALRDLLPDELEQFSQALQWLIEGDGQIGISEFALQKTVRHHLASQLGEIRPTSIQYHALKPLVPDCSVVPSALANVSGSNSRKIETAIQMGSLHLGAKPDGLQILPREGSGLKQLDAAQDRLALSPPQIRRNMLEACVQVVGADGLIEEREVELLRAIADTLDCPIPPFVEIANTQDMPGEAVLTNTNTQPRIGLKTIRRVTRSPRRPTPSMKRRDARKDTPGRIG